MNISKDSIVVTDEGKELIFPLKITQGDDIVKILSQESGWLLFYKNGVVKSILKEKSFQTQAREILDIQAMEITLNEQLKAIEQIKQWVFDETR